MSCADLAREVVFLDISSEALAVAESNFRTHFSEKKAQFIVSDLLINLLEKGGAEERSGGLVLEKSETPIPLSLCDIPLSQGGYRLLIEFGFDQRDITEKVIQSYGWKYEFFADYAGIERFCEIISIQSNNIEL